jgi:Ca2+-binding EF-hand superfamily protein
LRTALILTCITLSAAPLAPAVAQPRPDGTRPAPIFISPMGEPFREPTAADGLERWFAGADADRDGAIAVAELAGDAARFFATLDGDGDGEIEPVEMNRYEREVAPEIQLGTERYGPRERRRLRRMDAERQRAQSSGALFGGSREDDDRPDLEGAGRFGLINIPQPVIDADSDFNRGVHRAEFAAAAGRRFLILDTDRDGRLARPELLALLPKLRPPRRARR